MICLISYTYMVLKISAEGKALMICLISYTYMVLKSGQETLCFSLAFFCTPYGSYPISICWLILFYE